MTYDIRVLTRDDLAASADIVLAAFHEPAARYGFAPDSDKTRLLGRLTEDFSLGVSMLGAFLHGIQIGFVGIDEKDAEVYELRQLSVLPDYQRQGCGRALLQRAEALIREKGGVAAVGAIIGDDHEWKAWLLSCGYYEEASGFPQGVPCRICLLQKELAAGA